VPHDTKKIRDFFQSLPPEEIEEINRKNDAQHKEQSAKFLKGYAKDICYLCEKSFKTISVDEPCIHWLLRRCKFKKKDFPKVYDKYGYGNIAAYLRWCANQEKHLGNINDLDDEKSKRKRISSTIKWKNIEWTFDCSENDFSGHAGSKTDFPHYHFQMRIDGRPFISFGDFHIPFTDDDLFNLRLVEEQGDWFKHNYGEIGAGMQDAMTINLETMIENMETADESEGTFHLSTIIEAKDGAISGDLIADIFKESEETGKTVAALMKEKLSDIANVQTIVSPADSVPEIAKRTERKRR
jgi:hypothetical protein